MWACNNADMREWTNPSPTLDSHVTWNWRERDIFVPMVILHYCQCPKMLCFE